ncbi:hydroxymethylglutaryl-CoA synthase [Colletotrichum higginsianum]|nr:hydroxymethylglutaryl-CoA synthase [Colletotrichum higginsianum]
MAYPNNVGIKAMEIYVPGQALDQSLFEQSQGVSAGKYTIGLGLKYMNFCNDREDAASLALTAVSSLLKKYNIDPKSIGRLESIRCYISALDGCYQRLRERVEEANVKANGHGPKTNTASLLDVFDYMAFHTPNCKLVSKCYGRLLYNDYKFSSDQSAWEKLPAELRELSYEDSLKSKELEKLFVTLSKDHFKSRVEPCIAAPTQCGNMYTASLYCSLISLISNIDLKESVGKTIGMFSYGSGIASTLFAVKVTGDLTDMVQKINIMERLSQRKIATPEEYEESCGQRLNAYGAKSFEPVGSIENMVPGTYYLKEIDEAYRRTYAVKE